MDNLTRVESIYFAALEKDSAQQRAAYLDEACGKDPELRAHVERLLEAHPKVGSFLNKPAVAIDATLAAPVDQTRVAEGPGAEIGRYKLLEQIGEGGMGVVYMAEQREPIQRRVALKIIKPGMDSQQVIARFEAERQALAMMEHQNIARVLDVGTTSVDRSLRERESGSRSEPATVGRPYFVMELVRGVPITEYCDKNNLTPRERLDLFIPVCQAIQHAHQKGIIHRDIKPTNVLVCLYDGKPVPKVIDFGIAKAVQQRLTEKTMFTEHGQIIGTLEYMSPEQAEMSQLDVDTRSDVYSLGVLLYELLTGTTPINKQQLREAGFMEMLRLIREQEPDKPSTRLSQSSDALPAISAQRKTEPKKLSLIMRGELDWIVMKALEKDRTRRYESPSALAADVERYLKDESVQACPPSAAYKFRKLAHKHRVALSLAACFAAILVVGASVSTWQAIRATYAEAQANEAYAAEQAALEKALETKQVAEKQRDRALAADVQSKDTLARSLFEQARAVRLAGQTGSRWKSLDLLKQAESLRGRDRASTALWPVSDRATDVDRRSPERLGDLRSTTSAGSETRAELPSRAELRSEAVASLLVRDGRVERELGGLYQSVDPLGEFAGLMQLDTKPGEPPGLRLQIVELATGAKVGTLNLGADALGTISFALAPQAKLIATSEADQIRLTDVQSGRKVGALAWPPSPAEHAPRPSVEIDSIPMNEGPQPTPPKSPRRQIQSSLTWIEFSPDGRYLAAFRVGASVGEVALWKLPENLAEASESVGRTLLSVDSVESESAETDRSVRPTVGRHLATTRELALVSPNFSADSRRLAYPTSRQGVAIWNIQRDEVEIEFEIEKPKRPFGPLGFAPDGRSLALVCVSDEPEESAIVVWNMEADAKTHEFATGRTAWIAPPRISPDNRRLVTGTLQGEIAVFGLDEQAEEMRLDHGAAVKSVGWLDSDRIWSSGAMSLKAWELALDRPVRKLHTKSPGEFGTSKFTFSRDGDWMAVAAGKDVQIFRWPAGELHRSLDVPFPPGINLGGNGEQLVAWGLPGAAIMDLETGEQLFKEEKQNYLGAGMSDDGRAVFLTMQAPHISVTQPGRDEPIWQSSGSVDPGVSPVATISADGRRLATWLLSFQQDENPRSLEIWDLTEGRKIGTAKKQLPFLLRGIL